MTGLSIAFCFACTTTAFSAPGGPGRATTIQRDDSRVRTPGIRPGVTAFRGGVRPGPTVRLGVGTGLPRRLGLVASMDRAEFLEETNEDIYHENKKNPWHSFILALAPGLFYKPLAIGLSWVYCDPRENKKYVGFMNAVPTSGFGSFYSEWYWAGAVAMVGDAVGSMLITWYFQKSHDRRKDERGSMTRLYAGIVVSASAWVFDIIMGPVGAIVYNKALRRKFLSEAPARRIYHMPPLPEVGLATLGPQPAGTSPVVFGYGGRF